MLPRSRETVDRMLGTESYDSFFDDILGRHPRVVPDRADADRLNLFGPDAKQIILNAYRSHAPRMTHHAARPLGAPPGAGAVDTPAEFAALIGEYHDRGYTVRIPEVAPLFPALARFVRALEEVLLVKVEAELFWSAEGLRAPVHYDDWEIIAIQLVGEKRWFISHAPSALPNPWKRIGEKAANLGDSAQVDMRLGDLLYIPRGTTHTVHSTTESLHLSIGFAPLTVRDAIAAMLDHLSDLDRPLRLGATPRADDTAHGRGLDPLCGNVRLGLARLSEACRSREFVSEALDHRASRLVCGLPALKPAPASRPLTSNSRVRHSDLAISKVIATPEILDFGQPGGHTLIHLGAEPCVRFVAANAEFRIGDIPGGISDDVRVALVSRLVGTGFLEPLAP